MNSHPLLVGMQKSTATLEGCLLVSYKTKHTLIVWSSNCSSLFIQMSWKLKFTQNPWLFTVSIFIRLLRVPWTSKRSMQSILKEINPEYSLEGLMLKLKLKYFGHLMRRTNWLEKTLMLGKIEGRGRGQQRWDGWMASLTWGTWVWVNSWRWWRTGRPGVLQSMRLQTVGHDWATEQQQILITAKTRNQSRCPRTSLVGPPC